MKNQHRIQTINLPFETLDQVEKHIEELSNGGVVWTDVGILIDQDHNATLILLLSNECVMAVLRINLSIENNSTVIVRLLPKKGKVIYRSLQGKYFSEDEIRSLADLNDIWKKAVYQSVNLTPAKVKEFFKRLESNSKTKGRGKNFTAATKRSVIRYSHGRCMFEGCGEDLQFDDLTGTSGNFSYLAHNVASAEDGERGIMVMSNDLSDSPENVLLLCDKHHRLIDKVAAVNFPAHLLSKMRRDFGISVNKLLNGLSYQPISAYSILWPVHKQVISGPSDLEISQCFESVKCRLRHQINDLSDNEAILRKSDLDSVWSIMPNAIEVSAETILQQTHHERYKAGLFAIGLPPALIALGAKIGNKNNIIPMLRYRDGNRWMWPADKPNGKFYTISGVNKLSSSETDVILIFAFTAEPKMLNTAANEISARTQAKIVTVRANNMGNGTLAHPDDGFLFTADMQKLLHKLKDKHNVNRLHLLTCASNAACVFLGMSFDNYHPELLIYDFFGDSMAPRIAVVSHENKCNIENVIS